MYYRALIRRHPHVTAMVTFVLAFLIWGWLLPWVWHQPRDWATAISMAVVLAISMAVVLALVSYFNRLRAGRVKALIMGVLSLGALVLYASSVYADGIPQDTTERFYFAVVVAIPVFGVVLALWMLRKSRVAA
jgi:peptidoglycan/LPS O-acetylase OafA/YrhL